MSNLNLNDKDLCERAKQLYPSKSFWPQFSKSSLGKKILASEDLRYIIKPQPDITNIWDSPKLTELKAALELSGYQVREDKASIDGKNWIKIGKILGKSSNPLLSVWKKETNTSTAKKNGVIVLTINPIDVMNVSYNRSWTSCLSGGNYIYEYLFYADRFSIAAYFTTEEDTEVKNPFGRCWLHGYKRTNSVNLCNPNIPRHIQSQNNFIFFDIDTLYGNAGGMMPNLRRTITQHNNAMLGDKKSSGESSCIGYYNNDLPSYKSFTKKIVKASKAPVKVNKLENAFAKKSSSARNLTYYDLQQLWEHRPQVLKRNLQALEKMSERKKDPLYNTIVSAKVKLNIDSQIASVKQEKENKKKQLWNLVKMSQNIMEVSEALLEIKELEKDLS